MSLEIFVKCAVDLNIDLTKWQEAVCWWGCSLQTAVWKQTQYVSQSATFLLITAEREMNSTAIFKGRKSLSEIQAQRIK